MAETTIGQSYLMNYYLGRQSIIEFAYQLAMMDAKKEEQKRQLLLEQQAAIQKQIQEYDEMALKLKTEKAKIAAGSSGNASAIINGYIGIGNIRAKSQSNQLRAQELAQDQVTAPANVKTYIMNSSSDRAGQMSSLAGFQGFLDAGGTQFAEVNQALSGLTAEQRYDAVLNLADQVNAEMIGDRASQADRAAAKNTIFAKYLPGVTNPTRADYNTKAQAKQQQLSSTAPGISTAKLDQYLSTLTTAGAGGTTAAQYELGLDALVEASLAEDGEITIAGDREFFDAAKAIPGVGKYLKDNGFINYDPSTFTFRKKGAQESQTDYDAAKAAALTQYNAEFDQAINGYFMSRIGTPEAQLAKRIGEQQVQLGIVQEKIQKAPVIGSEEFRTMFGQQLQDVMTPEMLYDTKTREGRKNLKVYEMNKALEAQMAKMSPTDVEYYKLALQTAEDYETLGYANAVDKYSSDAQGTEYGQNVVRGVRNGTMDKNKVIPDLTAYLASSNKNPEEQKAFRNSALGLIYLDQYRTTIPESRVMKKEVKAEKRAREQAERESFKDTGF